MLQTSWANTRTPSPAQLQSQLDQLEETQAGELAAKALGLRSDVGVTAIQNEMLERVHEALSFMDWAEDTLPMFPDDYSDWMEESQSLRHGG